MIADSLFTRVQHHENYPPLVVAELSGNHNGSFERAMRLVEAAAEAGVDAIKLQTYTAETMTLDCERADFRIEESGTPWDGWTLYQLYKHAHTPWDWHAALFEAARQRGLVAFSAPFDVTAVDFLEGLDTPLYKIASFENSDHALLRKVAATGKPVIMSTGTATLMEITEAVDVLRGANCEQLIVMKCTSSYPASPADSNLRTIPYLRQVFGCEVGLSDHTLGIGAAVASVALGARIIEKHVTLSRADGGVDADFSLEPDELKSLVQECRRAWEALGLVRFSSTDSEKGARSFRRSLYFVKNLNAGDSVTEADVRSIRPGYGLSPARLSEVIGLRVSRSVERGEPVSWDVFKRT